MGLIGILKGIGNMNVIWFCNYNRNYLRDGLNIGIRTGNAMVFSFNSGICLEIYNAL